MSSVRTHRGGGLPTSMPTSPGTVVGEPLVWSATNNKWSPQGGTWYFTNTSLFGNTIQVTTVNATTVSTSTLTASGKVRADSEDVVGVLLAGSVVSPTAFHSAVVTSGLVTAASATVTGTAVAANFTSPLASHTTTTNSGLITTGTLTSTGLATVGNLNTAGSVVAATQLTSPVVVATTVTASGLVSASSTSGTGAITMGVVPAGVSNDYGVATTAATDTLSLWSIKSTSASAVSVDVVADINATPINNAHKLLRIGHVDNSDNYTEVMSVKDGFFEFPDQGSVELLSTELNSPSVTAITLGTESVFTLPVLASGLTGPRAKLLSIVNGSPGLEKFQVDVTGNVCLNELPNGQSICFKSLSEEVTLAAAAGGTLTTAAVIPSGSVVHAVSSYVTATIPTAQTFDVGVSGITNRYGSKLLGTVSCSARGMEAGPVFYDRDTAIRITPNLTPATATGKVRVTIHYVECQPPTS
jgi:hypothetical protein